MATAYQAWSDVVRALGGAVTTMPKDQRAAARYPAEVWVSRVNSGKWPIPDAFVNAAPGQTLAYGNGKRTASLGYYLAPTNAQDAAKRLAELTTRETIKYGAIDAAQALKETGQSLVALPRQAVAGVLGVPPWVVPLAIGVGVYFIGKALLPVVTAAAGVRLGAR